LKQVCLGTPRSVTGDHHDGDLERIPDIYRTTFEPLETLSHVPTRR
jgi:hypothetical protein